MIVAMVVTAGKQKSRFGISHTSDIVCFPVFKIRIKTVGWRRSGVYLEHGWIDRHMSLLSTERLRGLVLEVLAITYLCHLIQLFHIAWGTSRDSSSCTFIHKPSVLGSCVVLREHEVSFSS